jgi:hypothetical protein
MNAKAVIQDVFSKAFAEQIWTANTYSVFPVTPMDFSVGAVLPAVFYMFRWGHRRGKGKFSQTFGFGPKKKATIFSVAGGLTNGQPDFATFDNEIKKNLIGDLLLCHVLDNKRHEEGHDQEVQRVFPTHYLSSWIDLPDKIVNLRFVPEMLVALLANQPDGRVLQRSTSPTQFSVAIGLEHNPLLRIFAPGVSIMGPEANVRADTVDESVPLAVDQLLTVRLAQLCGEAPDKLRGAVSEIPNNWSINQRAAEDFREDLSILLRSVGSRVPRLTFVPMLESLIGLGLFNLFLGTTASAVHWHKTGRVFTHEQQQPWPVFVDSAAGADHALRRLSEESVEGINRLLDEAPAALMSVRILDAHGRDDDELRAHLPKGPDSIEWLNLLGQVRFGGHESAAFVLRELSRKSNRLAERLTDEQGNPESIETLKSSTSDPVGRLADAICSLMGPKPLRVRYSQFLDSCLQLDSPHGLGQKRRVRLAKVVKGRATTDVRSIILSNTLLDTLVHRHLCSDAAGAPVPLSFARFLEILRERYGLWVDHAPPGISPSEEELRRNRQTLERRLRDLGLLAGVNDAESMKRLRPRYHFGA